MHLASITEAVLHYCALRCIGKSFKEIDWTYQRINVLYSFGEDHDPPNLQIVTADRVKKSRFLSGYIDFQVLNKLCLREKIIDDDLFKEVQDVRKLRNKIHLFGLELVDRQYTPVQVDMVAKTASKVIAIAKEKLE